MDTNIERNIPKRPYFMCMLSCDTKRSLGFMGLMTAVLVLHAMVMVVFVHQQYQLTSQLQESFALQGGTTENHLGHRLRRLKLDAENILVEKDSYDKQVKHVGGGISKSTEVMTRDSDKVPVTKIEHRVLESKENNKMPVISKMPVAFYSGTDGRKQIWKPLKIFTKNEQRTELKQRVVQLSQEGRGNTQPIVNVKSHETISGKPPQSSSTHEENHTRKANDQMKSFPQKAGNITTVKETRAKSYRKHSRSKHSVRSPDTKNNEFEETNMEHFKTDEEWQPEEDWLVENLIAAQVKPSKPTRVKKDR